MTHVLTCDWCGGPIDSLEESFAQLVVNAFYRDAAGDPDGKAVQTFRDFHGGARGDADSCLARALALLDGAHRSGLEGLAVGWDGATRLSEVALPPRVVRVLERAGVGTVGELAWRRDRLGGVRGIGARALERIDEVLEGTAGAVDG